MSALALTRAERAFRTPMLGRQARTRRKKALRPMPWPRAEALRYTAELRRLVAETVALVRELLLPRLSALVAEAGRFTPARTDDGRLDDASDTLKAIIEAIMLGLGLTEERARRRAVEMLERVQRRHAGTFVTLYEDALAVNPLAGAEPWLREQMALAVKENARLIQSLPEQMLSQIEGAVNRGVLGGLRHEDLAKQIIERFGVADSRAVLIARDQVSKWHGSLQHLRQVDAGVTTYTWSTSQDERVRPGHRALNGTVQDWEKPPVDSRSGSRNHPGAAVLCRCVALPIIPDFDDEDA
jgi:SPP1 gp7 family putative phage head morphogenesis protein